MTLMSFFSISVSTSARCPRPPPYQHHSVSTPTTTSVSTSSSVSTSKCIHFKHGAISTSSRHQPQRFNISSTSSSVSTSIYVIKCVHVFLGIEVIECFDTNHKECNIVVCSSSSVPSSAKRPPNTRTSGKQIHHRVLDTSHHKVPGHGLKSYCESVHLHLSRSH